MTDNSGTLQAGGRARVEGLSGRSDLNGLTVLLLEYFPDAGRWAVQVETAGEMVRVRTENLVSLPDQAKPTACAYSDARCTRTSREVGGSEHRKARCGLLHLRRCELHQPMHSSCV